MNQRVVAPGDRLRCLDFLPIPGDGNEAPKQFCGGNRRIVVTQAVTPRDQAALILSQMSSAQAGNNPVHKHPSLARVQHDVSDGNFGHVDVLDGD
jgi:hypothetical protein